jgi:lysophospholipase L1-like esterase
MMGKWKRRITSLAFMFVLVLSLVVPNASANAGTVNYLALGDSLAAGQTPNKTIDNGYSDFAAAFLKEKNLLGNYSKAFAVPGDKTDDVLEDLTLNAQLRDAVKNSNTITISAGANDLLKESKLNLETKTLIIDETKVPGTLQKIAVNYTLILKTIKELNPNAKVFVMGYYFPFPYIADLQKPKLIELTHTLNKTIELSSASQGATFVPVYEKFGEDTKKYLPNPLDIHPNSDGYKLMSKALVASMFKPSSVGKAITRAEVASIIYLNIPTTNTIPANPGFKDVPETHPSYMAIAKLTEVEVFAKNEKFNPDAPITRVQLAKVIATAFDLKGLGPVPKYKDINATYWATPNIHAVSSYKIMMGYSNGSFGVNDNTSRAQIAAILLRVQALLASQ